VKELSASIPRTLIDVRQIEQALINLIANAEEAILEFHGIGKIEIKTRVVEGQIEIVIKDDGPGISKKNLPRIFDPFFTTKAKGTGLGLTVSYDIIAEHGGVLRVESEWGKGTFFIITLPIIEVQDGKQNEVRIEKSLKGTKGLVIDDEPSFLDSVLKYLRLEGSEVVPAVDAKTALNIIESKDFDFVICDIKMPGISGPDFYRIIREKRLFLCDRIIFMTGDLLSDTTRAFLDSVTNPNIEKPFNLDELKEIIVKMLEKNR
jgi:CheY-like chemotaxis protein